VLISKYCKRGEIALKKTPDVEIVIPEIEIALAVTKLQRWVCIRNTALYRTG